MPYATAFSLKQPVGVIHAIIKYMKKVLLTGGAGYIGTHIITELISANYKVVVVDNLVNSYIESLRRTEEIIHQKIPFYQADVRDTAALNNIFQTHQINAVIHLAGLKSVKESVAKPLEYYNNNIGTTLSLLDTMSKNHVKKLLFSSSATVYGLPQELPLQETSRVGTGLASPYARSKLMIEQIIQDFAHTQSDFQATILRFFNPIGAHPSGKIGEHPNGVPNNLLPYITQVAIGKLTKVDIFGDDYNTLDGTGIRDYIHVVDLAKGHIAALQKQKKGVNVYNLGTGHGSSVLEVIKAFSTACGHDIPYEVKPRRDGDLAAYYADCSKAEKELHWQAELDINQACIDAWRWQRQNPEGYHSTL